MLVFTHSDFQLDLSYLNVTFTEINQWFKDDFSTEQSFPFDLYLDSELSKNSGFQEHYNANKNQTIFQGHLDKDGEVIDAVLTFQGRKGKVISAIIKSGLDNFPSFDKKLSELNLEIKAIDDIVAEANSIIGQEYPAVNYNFKMVHTDKYDPTSSDWNGFEKIINNHDGYGFLSNSLGEEDVDVIKNILQPLPYLMHVLKTGIEDGGYSLAGDILTDPDLNQALVFRDGDYFKLTAKEDIPFSFLNNQWDSLPYVNNTFQYVGFDKEITITKKGDYLLFGEISSLVYSARKNPPTLHDRYRCSILDWKIQKVSGGVITDLSTAYLGREDDGTTNLWVEIDTRSVDISVSLEIGDKIRVVKTEPKRDYSPSITPDHPEAVSLKLIPQRLYNSDGTPILSVELLNEIDLTKVVPDMTFRQLVTAIKNLKNYEFVPVGNVIYMNLIENRLDRSTAKNLENFDVEEPSINYHDDREYELSFTDGKTHDTYKYDSVLVTAAGVVVNDYTAKQNVNRIQIDALPLPVVDRNGKTTAFNFEDQPTKLRLVFANQVAYGNLPVTFWNENMTVPKIRENNYAEWLDFRINSIEWNWEFIISVEKFKEITIQSLVYAYKNYHVLSEIEKERLNMMYWRITAKTESLL